MGGTDPVGSAPGLTRRSLLRTAGLATVIGAAGCSGRAEPQDPDPARFPGDPGRGQVYVGATLELAEPLHSSALFAAAPLAMSRRFYRAHQLDRLAEAVRGDVASRVLPFVSCKPPLPWADMAAGDGAAWLDRLLDHLDDVGSDVWLALHHEPENDRGRGRPEDWVALQQHVRARAERRAPRVTVVPVLMQWTFTRASGRDARRWLVPESPLLGVDVYNRWRPGGHALWEEFGVLLERVRDVVGEQPVVVPELGCRSDPDDPLRGPNWIRNAFQVSVLEDVVGLAYFDAVHQTDQSYRLDADRLSALGEIARRPEAARPDLPSATIGTGGAS